MSILALDIGGTAIKYSLFDSSGVPLTITYEIPTPKTETDNHIIDAVDQIIIEMKRNHDIAGVAVSTAGVVDAEKGTVVFAGPTIPGYTNTPIKQWIEETAAVPCEVENDVNCAALGEFWKGAGKGSRSLVCVTVGTGVGGAIILDGKVWKGSTHSAGEIGYLPLSSGHTFQDEASTTALVRNYSQMSSFPVEELNGKIIFKKAKAGDADAARAIDELIASLNQGLLTIAYLIAPDMIVIGGGIAAQKEYLENKINDKMKNSIVSERLMPKSIRCADLGNTAGMIGALYHFKEKHPSV
ncbi:ROK family protein [Pisciglobus halotolerans]|uniref:Sugar kinase of the NBD/HSP70 family, may contain an N-terminal HTH domain n=1 Tax=Pisciglobus halotolerans TaxID=745365 RepID=A0A1I3CBA3_9LACT|nr:ROK family protein [Pisciglobus halotolerans]SFH71830.1 Sugar kinase of the NBD/HSP70 family, may contain an N-terminal HTH domain [Pisciglobus halotolerans]